mgnify:CR=1 FL=1
MSKPEPTEDDLVASLYDAALEPEKWGTALQNISRCVDVMGAHVILWQEATQSTPFFASTGVDEKAFELYGEYWGAHDPRRKWLMENPGGQWVGCQRICDDKTVETSPLYQEYSIPWNIRHCMLGRIGGTPELSAMMAIGRPPGTPAFDAQHEKLLARHNLHLESAIRVQLRLSEAAARVRVLEELAHQITDAMLILKADGRVHFMNAAAEDTWSWKGAPLTVRGGRLSAKSVDGTRLLRTLVESAAKSGAGGALRLSRAGEGVIQSGFTSALNLVVCPLSVRLRIMHAASEPLALVMIFGDADSARATPAVLQALFGFTPAETRLALALTAGDKPDDYAAAQQVKISTVRTQITALKDKTGTRRHSDLVALLLKVPVAFQSVRE